jgi:uncharacterized membrane protein
MSIVDSASPSDRTHCVIEAAATGVAYGAALFCASTLLVASFRPYDLAMPYWSRVSWLRTDTGGAASFVVVGVTLVVSEYLRLRRNGGRRRRTSGIRPSASRTYFARAVAEVIALLATGLVVYLSVNSVTHPATLLIHATHFASWPTEGTLRVCALLLCVLSVGSLRFMTARLSPPTEGRG